MHWANLDDVSNLLALENAIPSAPSHSGHVQEFCTVYHMIIWSFGQA